MAIEITLTDREIPASPFFVDFVFRYVSGKPHETADWGENENNNNGFGLDNLVDSSYVNRLTELVMADELGRECVKMAYDIFFLLLIGDTEKLQAIFANYKFLFIVGVPRSGGAYLTKEALRAVGCDPRSIPYGIVHDIFPVVVPFGLTGKINTWTSMLQSFAEYLAMLKIYFGDQDSIIIPKKLINIVYDSNFVYELFKDVATYVVTVRHPATAAISTYTLSGGFPSDGKFKVRSSIEGLIAGDLRRSGLTELDIFELDYFAAYLIYWERYYSYIAKGALAEKGRARLVPFVKDCLQDAGLSFHMNSGSAISGHAEFHVYDRRREHPEWIERSLPVINRVADLWGAVGMDFPKREILAAW